MKEVFMIPGVGGLIEKNEEGIDYLLIQKRCKEDAPSEFGLFEIPAGKIRAGENIFDCLRREVKEETGLILDEIQGEQESEHIIGSGYETISYMPFSCTQNTTKGYPIMVQVFICKGHGTLLNKSDESQDLRWISLKDLENLLQNESNFYPMHIGTLTDYLKYKKMKK